MALSLVHFVRLSLRSILPSFLPLERAVGPRFGGPIKFVPLPYNNRLTNVLQNIRVNVLVYVLVLVSEPTSCRPNPTLRLQFDTNVTSLPLLQFSVLQATWLVAWNATALGTCLWLTFGVLPPALTSTLRNTHGPLSLLVRWPLLSLLGVDGRHRFLGR